MAQSAAVVEGSSVTTTVEICVRTLDSSNYTLRVDKDVSVPALKDQLAPVVGVPPQNQRLICRGRVLKDDQLLSSYNVEDGHTLHLVPRPAPAPTDDPNHAASETAAGASTRGRQITHSVLLGTFNIPDAAESGIPDIGRIISAVLNSAIGTNEARRGVSVMQLHSASGTPAASATPAAAPSTDRRRIPSDNFSLRNLEVPSDALTTLSHYLTRMEHVFVENGYVAAPSATASSRTGAAPADAVPNTASRPLPTPAALGGIIRRVQELLQYQTCPSFSQLSGQLENEAELGDPAARTELQATAVWSGNIMQQLGALLMELGRTTITLRLGPSPTHAIVNSGPAIFVSPSGPNPMMVQQPLPFSFASPLGSGEQSTAPGSLADLGRRIFSSSFHPSAAVPPDGTTPPAASQAASQETSQAAPLSAEATANAEGGEESQPNLGFLVQDNGSVRIVPMRGRSAASASPSTGINIQSTIRGIRAGNESAIAVPVLGIRAQVHTDWTQAVLQASEGQRPVGIALSIPVDVAATQAGEQQQAEPQQQQQQQQQQTDWQSILAAVGSRTQQRGEAATVQNSLQTEHDGAQSSTIEGGAADTDVAQRMETETERASRKRAGEDISVNGGEASCMSSAEDSQSSEAKRQKL